MKYILSLLILFLTNYNFAQSKYLTKTGTVIFEASVPSFEEVKGKNTNTTAILNSENGDFAALVLVKGFRFKNALMEEHFNENYAESDDFPKGIFKGTFDNFSMNKLSSKPIEIIYNGSLSFHGETKQLSNKKLNISINKENVISISGEFIVNVSDFKIDIPKIVSNKLSREVKVYFDFQLEKTN